MTDYKVEAAKAALSLIKNGQTIGLGAGSTVAHLINLISQENDLANSLIFTSSSFKTTTNLLEHGLRVQSPAHLKQLDIYFDLIIIGGNCTCKCGCIINKRKYKQATG